MGVSILTPSLAHIINQSVKLGIFPDKWKEAKVLPLHKSGDDDNPSNYRPISILPVLSKIIERHVHNHLYKYLDEYNLIYEFQSGFRPKHSCETALLRTINTWLKAIDESKIVGAIFLDLQKAFDVVNHEILLDKLSLYGMSQVTLRWFRSYLYNRKQKVTANGYYSDFKNIISGVPQGSILGPLLFILFINDIFMHENVNCSDLYADDSTMYAIGSTVSEVEKKLILDLKEILKWCSNNKMYINEEKTKSMLLCTRQKKIHLQNDLHIQINENQLKNSHKEKVLGVHIDEHLSWTQQIDETCKKVSRILHAFRKSRKNLPLKTRILFYNAYILPYINYCCPVWGNCSIAQQNRLVKLQKMAARLIMDEDFSVPSQSLFTKLKWLPFPKYVQYHQAKMVYKSLNNMCPSYMNDMFSYIQDSHGYNTRNASSSLLAMPKTHKSIGQKSFSYAGAKVWNNLSERTRDAPSLTSFKSRCFKEINVSTVR